MIFSYLNQLQIYQKSVWVLRPYLEVSLDELSTDLDGKDDSLKVAVIASKSTIFKEPSWYARQVNRFWKIEELSNQAIPKFHYTY